MEVVFSGFLNTASRSQKQCLVTVLDSYSSGSSSFSEMVTGFLMTLSKLLWL